MKIDKVLIYGSSHFSQVICEYLLAHSDYQLVGYIPSHRPTIEGKMPIPQVSVNVEHNIKLSLQYNKRILEIDNAYNVHTGLLPEYGGRDIFAHTIKNKEYQQGLTLHKMTDQYDHGPIISKITYPVFEEDTPLSLYERQLHVAPPFVCAALDLLGSLSKKEMLNCFKQTPTMYKRTHKLSPSFAKYKERLENESS